MRAIGAHYTSTHAYYEEGQSALGLCVANSVARKTKSMSARVACALKDFLDSCVLRVPSGAAHMSEGGFQCAGSFSCVLQHALKLGAACKGLVSASRGPSVESAQ